MRTRSKQSGLTLPEMAVVIATIALLVGFGLPAIRALLNSFETQSGAKTLISTSLASARAIAAKEQHYAGVRFQQDLLDGNQYMIFIIHDPTLIDSTGFRVSSSGFRALEGVKPVKLPDRVAVADRRVGDLSNDYDISKKEDIDDDFEKKDMNTFSIIFSPSGKLVIRKVQVLRRNNADSIFNDNDSLVNPMFEDDYDNGTLPFQQELSRNRFYVYDKINFDKLNSQGRFDYLDSLEPIYINNYTGTMILPD